MRMAIRRKPVCASEFIPHRKPRRSPGNHLKILFPNAAFTNAGSIKFKIIKRCTSNSLTFPLIAERQGYGALYLRMLHPDLRLLIGNVPRWDIQMIDRGKDELQRAALCTDHNINALPVGA